MRTNKIAFTVLALMLVASFVLSACATATTVAPEVPVATEAPVVETEAPATQEQALKISLKHSLTPASKKAW
jgi:hypothetical protein